MSLKDTWVDKRDDVDINSADDINQVAHAVIELEKKGNGGGSVTEEDIDKKVSAHNTNTSSHKDIRDAIADAKDELNDKININLPTVYPVYRVRSYADVVDIHNTYNLDEFFVVNIGDAFDIPVVNRYVVNTTIANGTVIKLYLVDEGGETYVKSTDAQTSVNVSLNAGHYIEYNLDDGEGGIIEERVLVLNDGITNNPTKVSELDNDAGYISKETDPTVPSWAKQSSKPTYTASEVGADASGTANSKVSAHNTNTSAHNDIRLLIAGLTERLNALADSDDTTLDQMSEIVAYIKANKSLIDSITDTKVNVADIVNNLTTNVTNKPLSAAQGVALKALIDAITVPTKLSELSADSTHRLVTDSEKAAWNNKSDFSGKYADLSGKPTMPTVPTNISAFTNDAGYLTSFTETDPTVPSWAKAASKPSYTKSEVGLSNVDNVKQYSANNPPPYPVTSVNGKTGAVTITVPTKTSELTNNSGFLTAHQDISGKADKSSAETWTFTLKSGGTVTKKVVLA